MPLYLCVAKEMRALIERQPLLPGQRLPSLRLVAQQFDVSLPTAVQAYAQLEAEGLVTARTRSGFFVASRPVKQGISCLGHQGQRPREFSEFVRWLFDRRQLAGCAPLGVSSPSLSLYPVDKLHRISRAILRRHGPSIADYADLAGSEELRASIASRVVDGAKLCSPDAVLVTSGGMEALHLCLRATSRPGDHVIVEEPGYYGGMLAAESLHLQTIPVTAHPEKGIDLDEVETLLRRRRGRVSAIMVTPNFSNPLGSLMCTEAKLHLLKLAADFGVPIIEDDANAELYFGGRRPPSLKSLDTAENVLLCGTFSKTLSPGQRVGYIVSRRYQERLLNAKFATDNATSALPQLTIASYLEQGVFDRHLRQLRAAFQRQVEELADAVEADFPPGTKVTRPHGGYYVWVGLPPGIDAMQLHQAAIRERISIAPGPLFSSRRDFQNHIRLNGGHSLTGTLRSAFARLCAIVNSAHQHSRRSPDPES